MKVKYIHYYIFYSITINAVDGLFSLQNRAKIDIGRNRDLFGDKCRER